MKVLLTGFEPFDILYTNPSQIVVQKIGARVQADDSDNIITEILPTAYRAAEIKMRNLICDLRPSIVLSLGVASGTHSIVLERVALNLDDTDIPDNAGECRVGQTIVRDGPVAYWSTLPLERLHHALLERHIPTIISNHAGTYVCNHVFYTGRYWIERMGLNTISGLIHLPLMTEQFSEADKSAAHSFSLPLDVMLEAIEACLDVLGNEMGVRSVER